jgi:uncharacterized protein (DUF488 family)
MPSWLLTYSLIREGAVRSMCAPWGLLQLDLDEEEFRDRYVARLEKHGADKIHAAVDRLAREHDREGVVLLCWEDLAKTWCHRRILAAYLEDAGAAAVPELGVS